MNLRDKTGIKRILESYLIAFALTNVCGKETTDIFSLLFFGIAYVMLGKKESSADRKRVFAVSVVMAGIFTLLLVMGNWQEMTGGLTNKLFLLFYFGASVGGLFCLFYEIVRFILVNSTKVVLFEKKKPFPVKGFFLTAAVLLLCMIPFLLINFPAVMTPDSLSQYRQAAGIEPFNDHHPWAHTMLFTLFYRIGYAMTGDTYLAIAFYTVAQMILVSFAVSYVWAALYEMGLKKKICIAGVLLFVICPYNLIYSVTIWKDILFSMAVLVLTVTLFCLYEKQKDGQSAGIRDWILYAGSAFFMCMLRHNGFYAFIVSAIVLAVIFRKKCRMLLGLSAGVVILCLFIKGPVMEWMGVAPGAFVHNLCIPLQQVGRVSSLGLPMEEEEIVLLEKINTVSEMAEQYDSGCADNMKIWVEEGNAVYLYAHKGDYLKLWIDLGLRYPGVYLQALIEQTKGYWYPMAPEQTVYWGITQHETGLVSQPILKGPVVLKICELMTKWYTIFPVYGILYSMGAMFWILLLCMAVAFYDRRNSVVVMCQPVFWITMTLFLATPLVADLRYNYPLMAAAPVIMAAVFYRKEP